MNSGHACHKREGDRPPAGSASKRPSEDSGDSPRRKRHASTTASTEDVSRTDEVGRSPLHLAAAAGDVERVRELIARGAGTRLPNVFGWTPLHHAVLCEKEAAAELLAEADGGNDVQDMWGCTPLHRAARAGYVKIVSRLIACGSRTRVRDQVGNTPLHSALSDEKEAAAELLADADGSNDVPNKWGCRPIHLAAQRGYKGTVRKLLQSGTHPHVQDCRGRYPVQMALRGGKDKDIPKMILSSCALRGTAIDWEELQLGEEDRQFCIEEVSRCEAEIRLMEGTRVPFSSVSHHHLLTRHVSRVASRLRTGSARRVLRRDLARRDFPVYAELLGAKLRTAEDRRDRMDRCLRCFSLLSPPLPPTCAALVLPFLSEADMGSFVCAIRPESSERRSGCSR